MSSPRIVIITSNQLRHRYYCSRLAKDLHIAGIVAEAKSTAITAVAHLEDADQQVINRHFAERDAAEKKILGETAGFPDTEVFDIEFNTVNNPEVLKWIDDKKPDFILLYGSGIIREGLLDAYPDKIVNLHLGLSPYYKGSGTNFWPLVYNEPECVGATIHLAVRKVDAGAILHQVRPEAVITDRAHELGTKTIVSAIEALPEILDAFMHKKFLPVSQNMEEGKVFRNKDFNADAVRTMWQNFDNGMMQQYLAYKEERLAKFPVIEFGGINRQ